MKIKIYTICLFLILVCGLADSTTAQKSKAKKPVSAPVSVVKTEKQELDAAIALPPVERIEKLNAFIEAHPRSGLKTRAMELIVSAHAALGEEKLTADDAAGGTEQFRLAVAAIPAEMSDKLFSDVVFHIPSNLYLRGQQAASLEMARLIEDRVKGDPSRLLEVTAFYLGIEAVDDAMRAAELAIKLAPTLSAAYQARASARRMSLRLDEAATDYARALELDPKSDGARRSLADLRRATGKTEEALSLYRELLKDNPADEFARAGLVVSLFELGRKEEAEREFESALKELPNSLALLAGMAYWFAAHNDSSRAIEFAEKAVQIEPRYTWGDIALARGLLQLKRAVEAEQPLLVARQYGKFPTLDYEMASVLAAAGFYSEASATLSSSFTLKQDLIETFLAGHILAQANSFTELLAPERRASIFQFTAADNEASARSLKALLAFSASLNTAGGLKEPDVIAAAREFAAGDDDMRAFRRLYVAGRLLENNIAFSGVLEMMDAVTSDVEPALNAPNASVAVMAEELHDARAQAFAYGRSVSVPEIPRVVLSNIIRGRIEDLAGWALFNQSKFAESVVRLRRATSVLPENSVWWRNSMWHLGASLDANDKGAEALEAYYSSYKSGGLDPTRRAVIERLYRKVNGSLDGLETKIGPPLVFASDAAPAPDASQPSPGKSAEGGAANKTDETKTGPVSTGSGSDQVALSTKPGPVSTGSGSDQVASNIKPAEAAPKSETPTEQKVETTETKPVEAAPKSETPTEQRVETTETKPVEAAPTPAASPTPSPTPTEVLPGPPQPAVNDEPPADQTTIPPQGETQPAPKSSESTKQRPRRVGESKCSIAVSESALTIENNGGRAIIDITLEGATSTEGLTAATSDWSSLAVFPEPKSGTNNSLVSFSVTSISKKTGRFTITFKSPCGSKEVIVTVR